MFDWNHIRLRDVDSDLRQRLRMLTLEDGWMRDLLDDVYEDPRVPGVHVFYVEDAPHIAAWCTAFRCRVRRGDQDKPSEVFEFSIFVNPDYRGQGLGTKILKFARAQLAHQKKGSIAYPFDEAGKRTFQKAGISIPKPGHRELTPIGEALNGDEYVT